MDLKKIGLIILSACFFGCNRPNPNPELLDPIYGELQKQLIEVRKGLDDEKKSLSDFEKELQNAKPQTGQIKYAQKRYSESAARVRKLEELVKYTEIRIDSRIKKAREDYLLAWKEKKSWPDPNEYKEYMEYKKAQAIPLQWNVKERINKSR
jgi:hypothetical protein